MTSQFETSHDPLLPKYRLYSLGGLSLAAGIGSVLAGGTLISSNFRALGKFDEARIALILSIVGAAALFGALWFVPESWPIPDSAVQFAQAALVHAIGSRTQGELLNRHELAGGTFYSKWRAGWVAVAIASPLMAWVIWVLYFDPASVAA